MFCMKCGTRLPTEAAFCFNCGTPVATPTDSEKAEPRKFCRFETYDRKIWTLIGNGTWVQSIVIFSEDYSILYDSGPFHSTASDGTPEREREKANLVAQQLTREGWREECRTRPWEGPSGGTVILKEDTDAAERSLLKRRIALIGRDDVRREFPHLAEAHLELSDFERLMISVVDWWDGGYDAHIDKLKRLRLVLSSSGAGSQSASAGVVINPPESTAQWETCEIEARKIRAGLIRNDKYKLFAVATGPRGRYDVASSWDIPVVGAFSIEEPDDHAAKIGRVARDELVHRLMTEGWEAQPSGPHWYSQRFRRRLG